MKKLILLLCLGLLIAVSNPSNASAVQTAVYPSPVNVSIYKGNNFGLILDGNYIFKNTQTGQEFIMPPGISLMIKNESGSVAVYAGSNKMLSGTNLEAKEVSGSSQLVTFTSTTEVRKGATSSYTSVATAGQGDIAAYQSVFTNSLGEKWYNVTTVKGITGWAPAATTKVIEQNKLSLFTVDSKKYRGSVKFQASGSEVQVVNYLNLEDYLKGVVPNEMPAYFPLEALKAQAIAARSYAKNSLMLSNTTASQVYRGYSSETTSTNAAVEQTNGLLVKYNGKPIQAFFHSTSGGRTANIGDVWNSNQSSYPYFKSVSDPYENSPHSNWKYSYSASSLLESFDFSSSTALYNVSISKTGANGEVSAVTLDTSAGSKTITGNELKIRKLFPGNQQYYGFLKSNWFDLSSTKSFTIRTGTGQVSQYNVKGRTIQMAGGQKTITENNVSVQKAGSSVTVETDPSTIVLTGKGWGHRIGMSQYGAKGFAEQGWTAEQILTHYYQGTTVAK